VVKEGEGEQEEERNGREENDKGQGKASSLKKIYTKTIKQKSPQQKQ
jgi:hypothetical protein